MQRRHVLNALCLLLAGVLLTACDGTAVNRNDDGKPQVVATTTMIADLARQIGGEDVQVISLMRIGEDPHIYEVRPRDAQAIAAADLVLMNGWHLESTLEHVVERHASSDRIVRLAESPGITPIGGDSGGAPDPHCWFNVEFFMVYAQTACDALSRIDPEHAEAYRQRTEAYLAELRELHAWILAQVDTVPRERRVMVTSHDAFQYYGERYAIDVHAVVGISTDQQPRPRDVQALERLVRDRGVKALFIETSVGQSLNDIVSDIARRTGARMGGTLYSDSLGPDDSPAGTYIGMMRYNTQTIVEALR